MILVHGYNENSFSKDVVSRWGMLSDELADDKNLLHPQMFALSRLCLENPDARNDILVFLEELLVRKDAISEIENAIAISFLQWPELDSMGVGATIAPKVADVVKTQYERFGSNS